MHGYDGERGIASTMHETYHMPQTLTVALVRSHELTTLRVNLTHNVQITKSCASKFFDINKSET